MNGYPRKDPSQNPRDPEPARDPAQTPRDPSVNPENEPAPKPSNPTNPEVEP